MDTPDTLDVLDESTKTIRALNDELRTTGHGGETYTTPGFRSLPPSTQARALEAVRTFANWSADNDPWQQHDCAIVDIEPGIRVMFKLDYYDLDKEWGSPDPADSSVTVRVLTILLPDEY
jgi:hypothetical protein